MSGAAYRAARAARHETAVIRGLAHHVVRWGPESDDPLLLLHGFADAAATFQFVADEMDPASPLVAVDWRGFGRSDRSPGGYWFPDYYADLERMVDAFCARGRARIVGHSMGANVAMAYAGLRPSRVAGLVNLEGFGLPRTEARQAPGRLEAWLDELREPLSAREFAGLDELAVRVAKRNPRLTPERAAFIAACWSEPLADGRVRLLADPAHRRVNPSVYRRDEMEACWRRIEAPVLLVLGAASESVRRLAPEGGVESFRGFVRRLAIEEVAGAGHMLHHEQPRAVAGLVERFFGQPVQ